MLQHFRSLPNLLRNPGVCAYLLAFGAFTVLSGRLVQSADSSEVKQTADPAGLEFFTKQIEPLLVQHCYECHGNGHAKGGLNLYTREAALKGGESGAAIDLDDPPMSVLLDALNYETYEMPPTGKLPAEQIALFVKWIELGAPMPVRTDVKAIVDDHAPPEVNEETRNHWAFRPLNPPPVPELPADWGQNPIDAFVFQQLRSQGLSPNPQADKATLARRLYYNLTGLPPTPQQVEAFLQNDAPEAYEQLVDKLLASPHYGEHWGRYWLDLVRYAESNSFERDDPKPFVWKYRDYVIRALNNDKPYNQFLLEQLAGDELPEPTPETITATGYYRLGAWDDEPADPKLAMFDELDDIIATTSQGFLGLTMNCARCHDHKLDPVPQADYYKFLAFFRNVRRYGVRSHESVFERSVQDIATPEEAAAHAGEVRAHEMRMQELRRELDEFENNFREHLVGGERDDFQDDSVRQRIIEKYVGKHLTRREFERYVGKRREWQERRNRPPQSAAKALAVREHGPEAPPTHILIRGNPIAEGPEVAPAFPSVLTEAVPEIVPPATGESTGRRLALARWITDEENGLTLRVAVNRLWQWNFGRGLVRTSSDFGLTGDVPTHPQLLEWLAHAFRENGQSFKALTKLMVMSDTWQMSSAAQLAGLNQDPLNDHYWRFDMRRLRAEEIRDSILAVNGTLNLDAMYGPSIYPVIPQEVLAGQSRPGAGWGQSSDADRRRRSIYIHIKRSLTVPLLAAFDVADTDFACPVRFATTQPTQALGMLNSEFLNEQARLFSEHLRVESSEDLVDQVRIALQRTTQRTPTAAEVTRGVELVLALQSDFDMDQPTALKNFCLIALNLNEFLYLD